MDFKLEVVVIPVSDVDRARDFYRSLGWRLDADASGTDGFRLVQLTPPGSACSIHLGSGLTTAEPGSAQALHLAVSDIEAARAELADHGVEVTEVYHCATGFACRYESAKDERVPGRQPDGQTYSSFANFRDPDGNTWVLQEITSRLPGR
jgi:catechol 2,3-dioxygenase-like lactoylglutathione lyase family enzyme